MPAFRLKLEHLWIITVLIGVFIFLNTLPIGPNDFWWHIAIGRDIVTSGEIPIYDTYSHTMAGQLYPSYQMFWLPEVVLYQVYQLGGAELIVFFNALIILCSYALLLWLCFRACGSWRAASVGTIAAIVFGIHNWNVRPQVVSYLIGVLFLWGIYEYRRKRNPLWMAIFPLGMVVWANSHGSFPIGLVLLGIWLADETWQLGMAWFRREEGFTYKPLIAPVLALVITCLATLVNPRGFGIVSYVLSLSANDIVQNMVTEWAPTTLRSQAGTIYIAGFLICTTLLIFSPKRPNFFQFITYLIFGVLLFRTLRGAVWFGLVMAPILADHLTAIGERSQFRRKSATGGKGSPIINLALLGVLLLLAVLSLPWLRDFLSSLQIEKFSVLSFQTPEAATEYLLENQVEGKIFNDMGFGSYLIWKAQPEYPVFVDPRIELYPNKIWEDYIVIINALPGWQEYLDEYGLDILVLSPRHQGKLIEALGESASWEQVYSDQTAEIFTRQ